jgi:hypothetical protein
MLRSARRFTILLAAALFLAGGPVMAEEALSRPSDKGVKEIFGRIEEAQKRFERELDGHFRKSVLRGPEGEVDVGRFLDDMRDSIERLRKRFSSKYSASSEARDLLARASRLHAYMLAHPEIRGANEWEAVALELGPLAAAYGTHFPLSEGAVVRRLGDRELIDAAESFSQFAGQFSKTLRKSTQSKADLAAGVKSTQADLAGIADACKALASRLRSGKPASADARRVQALAARVTTFVVRSDLPAEVAQAWRSGQNPLEAIEQAFGLAPVAAAAPATS